MALDAAANFCYGTVTTAPSPATSGTSMVVTLLGGCTMPVAPFNCTVWLTGVGPLQSNAEIVRVTSFTQVGATLTITAMTRAQESTVARTVVVGDQFALTITAKLIADITALGNGDVVGPAGSGNGNVAIFGNTSGKLLADGGTPAAFVAGTIHAAAGKTTPVDADEIGLLDSAASFALKVLTWANLKATLKTYFDGIYQPLSSALTSLAAGTIGSSLTFAENTALILDAALADAKYCGITEAGTAGTTLAFGDMVYLAVADSRWELADADAAATAGPVKIGMVVLAAGADGDATMILLWGKIRQDSSFPTFTVSAPVYVSTDAGDVQVAQPSGTDDVIRVIGFGNTADELFFCPENSYMTHV